MPLPDTNKSAAQTSIAKVDAFSAKLQKLVAALGGNENIENITHCMTRLRFKLMDESLTNKEKLENIEGVKGVVFAQGQIQVVIGVEVDKVV